jgi:hypothetical protein
MATDHIALHRKILPLAALQGALSTLAGFGGVLVYRQHGMQGTMAYITWMMLFIALATISPFVVGRVLKLHGKRVVRLAFAVPAVALCFAQDRPIVLALATGGFMGWSWAARHWLELSILRDDERDGHTTRMTATAVIASFLTTAAMATLLTVLGENAWVVYGGYAVLAAFGAVFAPRGLPDTPVMQWEQPWTVLRQPGFVQCLPLYFLQSGLSGISMALGASAAVRALGQTSHYGWVVSAATLAGALSLYAMRRKRTATNRVRWMAWACLGMVSAHLLLGASGWWPVLYLLHVLVQACVQPFWQASEQVLNQRALDLKGALADRIVVREMVLGIFRILALAGFGLVVHYADAQATLLLGALAMALSTVLVWLIGRILLARMPAS